MSKDNPDNAPSFDNPESLPLPLQEIMAKYTDFDYASCKSALAEFNALGWSFEYGLDAIPYGLTQITKYEVNLYGLNASGEPEDDSAEVECWNVWLRVDNTPHIPNSFTELAEVDRNFPPEHLEQAREYAATLATQFSCEINEY